VPSPVGTPQWRQELGDQVVWMASRLENRAELVLNPPQMGRIEVSLTVSGDQANAVFTSANPVVRDALEASLPRLREVLADAGIQLGQAQVGAENAQQSAQQDKNGDNFGPGREAVMADAQALPLNGGAAEQAALKTGRGLVDTFA
jgi:flagellar hook-length control protein FliK